jgi:hypothetical protein
LRIGEIAIEQSQSAIVRVTRWISCRTEGLAPAFCGIRPIRDIAVEIFRDGNFRGQFAPTTWHFDVLLFENNLAAVIGDFGSAALPFQLVERRSLASLNTRLKRRPVRPLPLVRRMRERACGLFPLLNCDAKCRVSTESWEVRTG